MGQLVPPPFDAPQEQWDRYLGHSRLNGRILKWGLVVCALLAVVLFFASCSHLTVAPEPVRANAVAMGDTGHADANVIDGDATGLLVRKSWLDTYFEMETKFKENIPADRLIKAEGDNYRVPYPVSDHFADLKRKLRLAEAGV